MTTTDTGLSAPLTTKPRSVRRIALSQKLSRWDVKVSPYLYISPFFILFALTGLFPLIYTAWVSVHEWNLIGGQGDFVGFDNFAFVLSNPPFWIALRNTSRSSSSRRCLRSLSRCSSPRCLTATFVRRPSGA